MEQLKAPPRLKLSGSMEYNWKRFKLDLTLSASQECQQTAKKSEGGFIGSEALDVLNSFQLTPGRLTMKCYYTAQRTIYSTKK